MKKQSPNLCFYLGPPSMVKEVLMKIIETWILSVQSWIEEGVPQEVKIE